MPVWVLVSCKSGEATLIFALAGAVLPPALLLVKPPAGTVLVSTPTCVAMTSARSTQLAFAAKLPPLILKLPAVVTGVAPQSLEALAGVAKTKPVGKLSVKASPVMAAALGLVIVKIKATGSAKEALLPDDRLGNSDLAKVGLANTGTVTLLVLLASVAACSPPPATVAVLLMLAGAVADTLTPTVMAG